MKMTKEVRFEFLESLLKKVREGEVKKVKFIAHSESGSCNFITYMYVDNLEISGVYKDKPAISMNNGEMFFTFNLENLEISSGLGNYTVNFDDKTMLVFYMDMV